MIAFASVLLVNDIPDHHGFYEAALRARGYDVAVVHTGADAMREARAAVPDCTVIDVRLPDVSGWDLCAQFKADTVLRRVPIVMLAQDVSRASADQGRRTLCNSWLARPTIADDVVRAIEHVLAQGTSEPASEEDAILGVTQCPACESDRIRAGVGVGAVQYYCCTACGLCWRVELSGEATA
jgi:DNA-binding response OmpR family regulator